MTQTHKMNHPGDIVRRAWGRVYTKQKL